MGWNKATGNKEVASSADNEGKYIRELLHSSCQGVKRLFILAYNNKEGDNKVSVYSYNKYLLPRVKIQNYHVEIDGRNFYDQVISDSVKQYNEIRKISTGQGDDYTTACLLDFTYFKKHYRLIAVDLSNRKALDVDSKAIQQITFKGKIKATEANTRVIIYYILEKSKETILQFSKGTAKVL